MSFNIIPLPPTQCTHWEALSLRDDVRLDVPTYSDRWSGKYGELSVKTDTQGAMASAGWAVVIGDAFGLVKLENMKWVYSNIFALQTYFGWPYIRSKALWLEK